MSTIAEAIKKVIVKKGGVSSGENITDVLKDLVILQGGTPKGDNIAEVIEDLAECEFGGGNSGGGIPDSDIFAYYDQPLTDAETNIRIMGVSVPVVIPAEITMDCEILNIEDMDWDTENYPLGEQTLVIKPSVYYNGEQFETEMLDTIRVPEELVPCERMQAYMVYLSTPYGVFTKGPFVYADGHVFMNEMFCGTTVFTNTFVTATNVQWKRNFNKSDVTIYMNPFETAEKIVVNGVSGKLIDVTAWFTDANGVTWYKLYNDGSLSNEIYDEYVYVKSDDVTQ